MLPVRCGLDVLQARHFAPLRGQRIGLITHAAAVDRQYRTAIEVLMHAPGLELVAVFGPEHGLMAEAQDLKSVGHSVDPFSGIRVHSLYGTTFASLSPTPEQLEGLDVLVIDLQDVGSRYYTFQATMLLAIQEANKVGIPVVILDRPNPLGGEKVEGPLLKPAYRSFVGIHPLVVRHGMTIGELALYYAHQLQLSGPLEIIPCERWRRRLYFDQTLMPWVMPSPNMPTLDTAIVYPGQCLLEGTNLSEGRGTTRPFEICGAPGIDAREAARQLNAANLPGVIFRPVWFQPTFQKHAGKHCGGVQVHVRDREAFCPFRVGMAVLATMRLLCTAEAPFDWRREPYEFVEDRLAIDLLFGSDTERLHLEAGHCFDDMFHFWEGEETAFRSARQPFLLYD